MDAAAERGLRAALVKPWTARDALATVKNLKFEVQLRTPSEPSQVRNIRKLESELSQIQCKLLRAIKVQVESLTASGRVKRLCIFLFFFDTHFNERQKEIEAKEAQSKSTKIAGILGKRGMGGFTYFLSKEFGPAHGSANLDNKRDSDEQFGK